MIFYIHLALFNFTIFLSYYLINIKEDPNPFDLFKYTNHSTLLSKFVALLHRRVKSDPFRIVFDYSVLLIVFKIFGFHSAVFIWILAVVGTFSWIYIIYVGIILFALKRKPLLKSDLSLLKVGVLVANNARYILIPLILLIIVGLFYIVYNWSAFLISIPSHSILLVLVLVGIVFLGAFRLGSFAYEHIMFRPVMSPLYCFVQNLKISNRYNYLLNKDEAYFEQFNLYDKIELKEKPNVYIISVESYGSVLLQSHTFSARLRAKYEEHESALSANGYAVASCLSTSPIYAGGSWLSYTSFTYGIRFSELDLYDLLFKDNSSFEKYESIFHFLKRQGYTNVLVSPIGNYNRQIDWDLIRRNFAADRILKWEDFEYTGPPQSFMKAGVCPPDQFTINKAEQLTEDIDTPKMSFFSTLNSHIPFQSPTKMVDDWEDLNSTEIDLEETHKLNIKQDEKYIRAIEYQLDVLLKFINDHTDPNAIFVLFGDHQPPIITKTEHGLDTPIHIITKNNSFLKLFYENGFRSHLEASLDKQQSIKHEGFYSLFMQAFNKYYGQQPDLELPYLEGGTTFENK